MSFCLFLFNHHSNIIDAIDLVKSLSPDDIKFEKANNGIYEATVMENSHQHQAQRQSEEKEMVIKGWKEARRR